VPALFAVLLLAGPAVAKPAELPLAADGKALVPVVVSEKASAATKQVAAELADHLGRITGAKFEVVAGDGTKGIVLGTIAEFPDPALARALAVRNTFDGREAFAIRTEPTRVLLVGATDLGVSHAAFRFLESLGCRWFFPAREWEVDPTASPSHQYTSSGVGASTSRSRTSVPWMSRAPSATVRPSSPCCHWRNGKEPAPCPSHTSRPATTSPGSGYDRAAEGHGTGDPGRAGWTVHASSVTV
jgi:hypothetical protein